MSHPAPPGDPWFEPLDRDRIQAALTTRELGQGPLLRIEQRLGSTNALLLEQARTGLAGRGTVLLAEEQTAGRGRGEHRWESPRGRGLYVSVLLQPEVPPESLGLVVLACGVAVCEVCELAGVVTSLRWPNDVLVAGRKLAGILCELTAGPPPAGGDEEAGVAGASSPPLLVVAGIGLNVSLDPAELQPPLHVEATSLLQERRRAAIVRPGSVPPAPSRSLLAASLLDRLEQRVGQCATAPEAVLAEWSRRWPDQGKEIQVVDGPADLSGGTAIGVDRTGALLLLGVPGRAGIVRLLSGSARAVGRPHPAVDAEPASTADR